jgi:hypothetical protein
MSIQRVEAAMYDRVVPGSLVYKLIGRGLTKILIATATSAHESAAAAAVEGLADLSRVKDCRLYLLQLPS